MSNRIFQGVVLQMKEDVDRTVGVIDAEGNVVACNDTSLLGAEWPQAVDVVNGGENGLSVWDGKTFRVLSNWGGKFEYASFVSGEDAVAKSLGAAVTVALSGAKQNYEEKHDQGTFLKNIISGNILLGDIYARAKDLHFSCEETRGVFLVRQGVPADPAMVEIIQTMFPDKQNDFVLSVNDTDVTVIKQVPEGTESRQLDKTARQIQETLEKELGLTVVVGIGTVVSGIRELARSYKEAQLAIEVGKVFETEQTIVNYENLGIGRLIYQLPTTLCEMYLQEVFKKNPIDALDQETLFTINKFFENNLNVSETARKLFVHRNTLVYRLEKIKKLTGLDLREFDDAITFKVALMVKKYLVSQGFEE